MSEYDPLGRMKNNRVEDFIIGFVIKTLNFDCFVRSNYRTVSQIYNPIKPLTQVLIVMFSVF